MLDVPKKLINVENNIVVLQNEMTKHFGIAFKYINFISTNNTHHSSGGTS